MSVNNVLAGVAVNDLDKAQAWYDDLVGAPGNRPMESVCEWSMPGGGALQVFEDSGRAGSSSVTLSVDDIEGEVERLRQRGVQIERRSSSGAVDIAIITDLDGNQVVLAQQHSDRLAR